MGFWDWITSKLFAKSTAFDRMLLWAFGGASTSSGVSITPEKAMECAAVYACVAVLSESMAQLPLHVYKRLDRGKDIAAEHPLYRLLHDRPNPWQTSFEFRQMLSAHAILRGDGLAYINRGGSGSTGRIRELIPIHPDSCEITQGEDYRLTYDVKTKTGRAIFREGEIFHLRGMTFNGFKGVSPITYVRESIGLSIAAEQHGARLFGNGARPGGVLETATTMKPEEIDKLRSQWAETQGGENAHKVAVLTGGMSFKPITINAEDSQFLETRKYQRSEIASIFRVPAHLINDLEKATFSNIEHLGLSFVVHSLMPWLVRWEQAISRDLFQEKDAGKFFAEHLVSGLLRGDIKSRYEAYGRGIQDGWLTRNEARGWENLNPIKGLDDPLQPLNMTPAGKEAPDAGNQVP